jgi:hypothetical protein
MDPNPLPSPEMIFSIAAGGALVCGFLIGIVRLGKIIKLLESIDSHSRGGK